MNAWILLVNRSEAKFFECDLRTQGEVAFVEKIDNPKGRLRLKDIDSDRPGFARNHSWQGGRLERQQNPKDRIMQMFAKKIVHRLEEQYRRGRFEELVIIAGPRFLGALRQEMSKELASVVVQEIPSNLTKVGSTTEIISDRVYSAEEEAREFDQGYLN